MNERKVAIEEAIEEIKRLSKKSEILEENNKLLIQQKSRLYEDLDMLSERIDKAIEYIEDYLCSYDYTSGELKEISNVFVRLMTKLKGEDNE